MYVLVNFGVLSGFRILFCLPRVVQDESAICPRNGIRMSIQYEIYKILVYKIPPSLSRVSRSSLLYCRLGQWRGSRSVHAQKLLSCYIILALASSCTTCTSTTSSTYSCPVLINLFLLPYFDSIDARNWYRFRGLRASTTRGS